jgi:hypothetical protein
MRHGDDGDVPIPAAASGLWIVSLTELRSRFADIGRRQRKIVCVLTHSIVPAWPLLEELPKPKEIATLTYFGCRATTLRDARQVFDGRREGNKLAVEPRIADKPVCDPTGEPILFSDGQPVSIELGATRQYEIYADGSTPERLAICEEFLSAAAQAGRCLHGLPDGVQRVVWRDWPDGFGKLNDGYLWINAVFELAWQHIPGSPLAADRWVWKGQQSATLDSLQHLRTMAKVQQALSWLNDIPDPPAHWYSVLEDLPSASVAAIDTLLAIDTDKGKEITPPQNTGGGRVLPSGGEQSNEPTDPAEILKKLKSVERKAYFSYRFAESIAGIQLTDREAYERLREDGIPEDRGDMGELTDYRLPDFDTWTRYLRAARKELGEQKYTPRHGRPSGGSVVHRDQI